MDAQRSRQHILFTDAEGMRHLVKVSAIQMVCDSDPLQNETVVYVAGRPMRVAMPFDRIAELLISG